MKCFRTDNGLEFCFDEFNTLCKKEGIVRHRTVRHTPQHNGVAKQRLDACSLMLSCRSIFG